MHSRQHRQARGQISPGQRQPERRGEILARWLLISLAGLIALSSFAYWLLFWHR